MANLEEVDDANNNHYQLRENNNEPERMDTDVHPRNVVVIDEQANEETLENQGNNDETNVVV